MTEGRMSFDLVWEWRPSGKGAGAEDPVSPTVPLPKLSCQRGPVCLVFLPGDSQGSFQ